MTRVSPYIKVGNVHRRARSHLGEQEQDRRAEVKGQQMEGVNEGGQVERPQIIVSTTVNGTYRERSRKFSSSASLSLTFSGLAMVSVKACSAAASANISSAQQSQSKSAWVPHSTAQHLGVSTLMNPPFCKYST